MKPCQPVWDFYAQNAILTSVLAGLSKHGGGILGNAGRIKDVL